LNSRKGCDIFDICNSCESFVNVPPREGKHSFSIFLFAKCRNGKEATLKGIGF